SSFYAGHTIHRSTLCNRMEDIKKSGISRVVWYRFHPQ
ncbi:uncharacterized protein METZ01_LOCUS476333, partial [marine metagenome]